jgi:UDP-glucose 4-epimerase
MRALVTGGCGFIGSHLVRRLLADGHDVTIIDDLTTGTRHNVDGLEARLVYASIEDRAALREALEGVEVVYHLAAMVSVPMSLKRPATCLRTNVVGTAGVLEEALSSGASTVVFASSAAVYGETEDGVQREGVSSNPSSPYGVSKRSGEQLCKIFDGEDLRCICLRFFNVYGPRQDPNSSYASVVPAFADRALKGEPIVIYGDGGQTRDFIQVADVVDAAVHCVESGYRGIANVGTGEGVSVTELAERIIDQTGSVSEIRREPAREGDIRHSVASVERLTKNGWTASFDLEQGLKATLGHYRTGA